MVHFIIDHIYLSLDKVQYKFVMKGYTIPSKTIKIWGDQDEHEKCPRKHAFGTDEKKGAHDLTEILIFSQF